MPKPSTRGCNSNEKRGQQFISNGDIVIYPDQSLVLCGFICEMESQVPFQEFCLRVENQERRQRDGDEQELLRSRIAPHRRQRRNCGHECSNTASWDSPKEAPDITGKQTEARQPFIKPASSPVWRKTETCC
jgi:hypothetical protein